MLWDRKPVHTACKVVGHVLGWVAIAGWGRLLQQEIS